ncbi:hypothetical protein ACN6LF_006104 [[Kitasatospora] papulosa]|uniref:hypothetical protein n=1 Tax=Streptomyces TaxID=1883 RepID=UPI0016894F26|nr:MULTISPECIES: hypothetical protein [unclassified Streptomyces]MBD2835149.1 hypothetical protein [Streptomyces pratensis]MCY1649331.1 hypothetical protein [Streptomyces sp. SL203]MCY1677043.1 hypothetical protein [Streptomyces sp. SL294]
MNTNESSPAPLRDVAQNAEATARYLADMQRVLLDMGANLEILQRETRVHCRSTSVEGDRWYHAKLRALPVEKALKDVLKSLNSLTDGLEKSAYKRRSHDEAVVNTGKARKEKALEKALEKARKNNPQPIQAAPNSWESGDSGQNPGYGGPASIYDLGKRSA